MVSKVDNRRSREPLLSMAGVDWTKTTSTKWEVAFSSNTLSFPYVFTTHKCTGLLQGLYVSNPCFPNQHVVRLTRRVVGQFVFLAVNAQYQVLPDILGKPDIFGNQNYKVYSDITATGNLWCKTPCVHEYTHNLQKSNNTRNTQAWIRYQEIDIFYQTWTSPLQFPTWTRLALKIIICLALLAFGPNRFPSSTISLSPIQRRSCPVTLCCKAPHFLLRSRSWQDQH